MISILMESAARSLGLGIVVWIVLKALRIRSPQIQSLAWTAVLFSAVSMPLLMRMMKALATTVPEAAVVTAIPWAPAAPSISQLRPPGPMVAAPSSIDWVSVAVTIYWLVVATLLVRLLIGLWRSWRLSRHAVPLNAPWFAGWNVRVSEQLRIPVTCGSTILVPSSWPQWDTFTQQAVLLHEQTHVRRRDFYVNLVAGLHRAVFWFSPFAWWLEQQLVELAEVASDDEAVRSIGDRVAYAGILVTLSKAAANSAFAGPAMARGRTVQRRVERMLHETDVAPVASRLSRVSLVALFLPLAAIFAGVWLVHAQPASAAATVGSAPVQLAAVLSGTVYDPTGAVVPGVKVTLFSTAGVADQKTLSNEGGVYAFSPVAPGQYTIEANFPTFATYRKTIMLPEAIAVRQDLILQLGRSATLVEVNASRSQIPQPAPNIPSATAAPLRIGGDVLVPTLKSAVKPVYPSRPLNNQVQDSVVLQGVVGVDGRVISLQVDPSSGAGNLELIKAAMDAVRQWEYMPAMLNGVPVEFTTTITVDFKLVD